jgi:hypothetical protein
MLERRRGLSLRRQDGVDLARSSTAELGAASPARLLGSSPERTLLRSSAASRTVGSPAKRFPGSVSTTLTTAVVIARGLSFARAASVRAQSRQAGLDALDPVYPGLDAIGGKRVLGQIATGLLRQTLGFKGECDDCSRPRRRTDPALRTPAMLARDLLSSAEAPPGRVSRASCGRAGVPRLRARISPGGGSDPRARAWIATHGGPKNTPPADRLAPIDTSRGCRDHPQVEIAGRRRAPSASRNGGCGTGQPRRARSRASRCRSGPSS